MNQDLLMELVEGILSIMVDKIVSIVLYGSVARGTNTDESDVDVALLMHGKLDKETEDQLSDVIVNMNLKYNKIFSIIDIDYAEFQRWLEIIPFYQNIRREGVVLWKAT